MIIDAHCHIFPESFHHRQVQLAAQDRTFAALFPKHSPRLATAESLIEAMDEARVDHAVVMGMGWTDRAIAKEVNDYLMASSNRYPGRLTGFCSVNPLWGDGAIAEVERCIEGGLRGIGELHPDSQGFDLTDEAAMSPLMETARRLGVPVLVHSSEPAGHQYPGKGHTTPDKLYRFIENFPDNVIICAHWGGGLPFYALMPEVPQVLNNVYFDSAASPFLYLPEVFAAVTGIVGPEKVLFATDFPLLRHRRVLRQVRESGLDATAQEAILGGNAVRLLGFGLC